MMALTPKSLHSETSQDGCEVALPGTGLWACKASWWDSGCHCHLASLKHRLSYGLKQSFGGFVWEDHSRSHFSLRLGATHGEHMKGTASGFGRIVLQKPLQGVCSDCPIYSNGVTLPISFSSAKRLTKMHQFGPPPPPNVHLRGKWKDMEKDILQSPILPTSVVCQVVNYWHGCRDLERQIRFRSRLNNHLEKLQTNF